MKALAFAVAVAGLLVGFPSTGATQTYAVKPVCQNCDSDWDTPVEQAQPRNDVANYAAQRLDSDDDDPESTWIGLTLTSDRRLLKSRYVNGLLIVDVQPGSPAAEAGLRIPTVGMVKSAAEMAAMAAGFMFPPAMLAVGIVSSTHVDESYDMIIGVDGDRVMSVGDFENRLAGIQPGERVYLNIIRNGARLQVPVIIPDMASQYCTSDLCSVR